MHDVLAGLVNRDHPVDEAMWRSFWDRLRNGQLRRGEAVALLASLSTRPPDDATLLALLTSLHEQRPQSTARFPGAVNIVGTGGGPKTFNISTAAAFVAAALGVRVLKTGSRAYSSRYGSMDLLRHLSIPLANSYEQVGEMLDRFGIACAGYFVYPAELALLAKSILPFDMRVVGRFINSIGPFLADVPIAAQLTGVSDNTLLPSLRCLAASCGDRRIWISVNDCGADELISFAENVLYSNDGGVDIKLAPSMLGLDHGTMTDLRPVVDDAHVVDHFLAQLAGDGHPAALQTIRLNAAALAVLSGAVDDWSTALQAAREVMERGAVTRLVNQIRNHPTPASLSMSNGMTTHA